MRPNRIPMKSPSSSSARNHSFITSVFSLGINYSGLLHFLRPSVNRGSLGAALLKLFQCQKMAHLTPLVAGLRGRLEVQPRRHENRRAEKMIRAVGRLVIVYP